MALSKTSTITWSTLAKPKPLLWCVFDIHGYGVPVYLSHHSITPDLIGSIGVTTVLSHPNRLLEIYIDASTARDTQDRTLAHEFFHACLWGKKALHWRTEERIAEEFATAGWRNIKIPRRPKGAKALEKYAHNQEKNA